MKDRMNHTIREAMRLMHGGDLFAATQAIQRGLRVPEPTEATSGPDTGSAGAACIEGEYRVTPDGSYDASSTGTDEPRAEAPRNEPKGEFRDHRFTCDAGTLRYKLFVPAGLGTGQHPLLVMLHGCTQSPDDFALGTRMNTLAAEHRYVIAYPEQTQHKNASKCWNWFRSRDQQRGRGEPALLTSLTRYLLETHELDERRVYVAGLSAGGAMAAVLGSTYPDVFAAIGVHSGLPFGVAHDLPSAFAAMKQQTTTPFAAELATPGTMHAIVFHGDRDTTVDPCNGAAVIAQFTGADGAASAAGSDALHATVERGSVSGGRSYTRTVFTNTEGNGVAEHWRVHGGGHAWFGGDPLGSYTDPAGPDASAHMLRFFAGCTRRAVN